MGNKTDSINKINKIFRKIKKLTDSDFQHARDLAVTQIMAITSDMEYTRKVNKKGEDNLRAINSLKEINDFINSK